MFPLFIVIYYFFWNDADFNAFDEAKLFVFIRRKQEKAETKNNQ